MGSALTLLRGDGVGDEYEGRAIKCGLRQTVNGTSQPWTTRDDRNTHSTGEFAVRARHDAGGTLAVGKNKVDATFFSCTNHLQIWSTARHTKDGGDPSLFKRCRERVR